jgi:hypothetical protein
MIWPTSTLTRWRRRRPVHYSRAVDPFTPGRSALTSLVAWPGPIPERLYHGSPYIFDTFDLARSAGVAWFMPAFNDAAKMARNFVRELGDGVAGVYECRLTCARIAYFPNEDAIFELAKVLTRSYERRDRLTAVSNALVSLGYDGMVDCYHGLGYSCLPSYGALRTDAIVRLGYVRV